ncbi:MAG: winged helix-turn-helix domain-containing protein [Candidatus Geothermarchaeales archaeon]
MKKRQRVDIYVDMLEVMKTHPDGLNLTRIAYGAGLPNDRAKRFLGILVSYGLARVERGSVNRYLITIRGRDFLKTYHKMRGYMTYLGEE